VEGTKSWLYFPTGAHANQLIKPVMGGADHGVIMRGGGHVDDEIIFPYLLLIMSIEQWFLIGMRKTAMAYMMLGERVKWMIRSRP
jgi:hypothetical protein